MTDDHNHAHDDGAAPPGPHKHTNALIHQTSPYLLQHAHNPVDWHPWGPEAIELARKLDKPIFLSVGYSTCYWCHVMERESFENEAIAALMNEHFICIKVDREERPDVDDIYMGAVQAMSGSGGWPMSVFLEPRTLKPFYGGTYYPTEPKYGRQSFPQLLQALSNAWTNQRPAIEEQAQRVADAVQARHIIEPASSPADQRAVAQAIALLKRMHDPVHGGFGTAPKFPQPVFLEFLMGAAWDDLDARKAILHTLDRMAIGGMYDQVGGGFHRYSTDEKWLVPHFEKMLYDNGQLASVYALAFERTGDAFYAEVLRETLDYVLREMTDAGTGFFSAQDAEVDSREGLNYLWLPDELRAALTDAGLAHEVPLTLKAYGLDQGANFRDPHYPEDGGRNVLFLTQRPDALARELGLDLDQFNDRLRRINAALLSARSRRKQPGTDDKVLAGWNGLMIAGMADGGRVLQEPRYLEAARRAAVFILDAMRDDDGHLLRSYRAPGGRPGSAKIPAFLEDHALLIRGLLALHRAAREGRYLDRAVELADAARRRFWDDQSGAYFDTLADQSDLFIRAKSSYDGAIPSGNGVMLLNLLELHRQSGRDACLADARATIRALSGAINKNPVACALTTLGLYQLLQFDPATKDRAAATPPATPVAPAPPADSAAVSLTASADAVRVSAGSPAPFEITLTMAQGFHINAHRPGAPDLVALQFQLIDGGGLLLHVDYPPGELYQSEIRIHRGTVTIPVRIERIGAVTGAPRLTATYQPCTDTACLRAVTIPVPVRVIADEH